MLGSRPNVTYTLRLTVSIHDKEIKEDPVSLINFRNSL